MSAATFLLTVIITCSTPDGGSQQALAKADLREHQLSGFEPTRRSSANYRVPSGTYTLTVEGVAKPRTITVVDGDSVIPVNIGECSQ